MILVSTEQPKKRRRESGLKKIIFIISCNEYNENMTEDGLEENYL